MSEIAVKPVDTKTLSLTAIFLGCAGVVPFLAAVLAIYFNFEYHQMLNIFTAYSAVILSFLGGIRWAQALSGDLDGLDYVFSVIPSLLACICLLLPSAFGLMGLMLGFIAMAYLDIFARPLQAPKAFLRLRFGLSFAVISLHALVLALVWQ